MGKWLKLWAHFVTCGAMNQRQILQQAWISLCYANVPFRPKPSDLHVVSTTQLQLIKSYHQILPFKL